MAFSCATDSVDGTGLVTPVPSGLDQVMASPASTANASGPLVPVTTAFGAREDRAKSRQKLPLASFLLAFSAVMPALDPLGRVIVQAESPAFVVMDAPPTGVGEQHPGGGGGQEPDAAVGEYVQEVDDVEVSDHGVRQVHESAGKQFGVHLGSPIIGGRLSCVMNWRPAASQLLRARRCVFAVISSSKARRRIVARLSRCSGGQVEGQRRRGSELLTSVARPTAHPQPAVTAGPPATAAAGATSSALGDMRKGK